MVSMDPLERSILGLLAKDSERSLQDMATELGIPSSTLHQKIRKLETKGVISSYQARIDLRAVGLKTTSFVSLTPIDPAAPDNVPEQLAGIPEIEGCWSVAGAASYIIKVNVSEPADLEGLLASIRQAANVRTETTVVLSTAFENRPPAIPAGEQ
jgi:Lrp/AsnC family leucine-responsive transcriptional regulator